MSLDLIDRVIYLNSKGETVPLERVNKWLQESENSAASGFIVDDEKYYWKIISSAEFNDILDEDVTDWLLIYSEKREFKAIAKVRSVTSNLIGEKRELYISSLWILKSDIESVQVNEMPICIVAPSQAWSSSEHLNYYFKQLLTKLKDPKVRLIEFVSYKISKSRQRRIR